MFVVVATTIKLKMCPTNRYGSEIWRYIWNIIPTHEHNAYRKAVFLNRIESMRFNTMKNIQIRLLNENFSNENCERKKSKSNERIKMKSTSTYFIVSFLFFLSFGKMAFWGLDTLVYDLLKFYCHLIKANLTNSDKLMWQSFSVIPFKFRKLHRKNENQNDKLYFAFDMVEVEIC